ncbi:uncharacterized protein N7479_006503 [Penicillium vulpinum]|uniref:uncharacterized protein n=1 Tax=Penicillium vulpinum TaxID=29845 RepID=UPI00254900E1|nr:uncharacterized protein N7479_006503 [Penicillium vulpinum]KAJ5959353.1 hypothetical protein N7479_006503 [Penicillium vulpinum]
MRSIILGASLSFLCAVGVEAVPHSTRASSTRASSTRASSTRASSTAAVPTPTQAINIKNLAASVGGDTQLSTGSSNFSVKNLAVLTNQTTTGVWMDLTCTPDITDATLDPTARWNAAGASDALNDAISAWNTYGINTGLGFPEFISSYFTGPDNWNCKDIGNTPCSTVLTCNQALYPAGSLGDALNIMQNEVGTFASTFAPQVKENLEIIKFIIDSLVMVASIGSSFAWNIALKGTMIAGTKYFSMGKDVTNAAAVSYGSTMYKDSLKSAKDALGTQNSISSALGTYFSGWTGVESEYISALFNGTNDEHSINAIRDLTSSGGMLLLSSRVDLTGMTAQAAKILYGQLIPAAWSQAPAGLYPRILRKAGGCSTSIDPQILEHTNKDALVGGYVCYNNDAFYVVNVDGKKGTIPFQALPGGNQQTLNGNAWGGVTLEDIVVSSYQGFQRNGNKNGYIMPKESKEIDGAGTLGDYVFQNGIRTPGFFNLPICDDFDTAYNNALYVTTRGDYWPCDAPEGYNPSGTNVEIMKHVNYGCINVDGETLCKSKTSSINIADQGTDISNTTIFARFEGAVKTSYKVVPGCKLVAQWPRAYGDIYFGADNCLYDSTGTNINGQCCTEATEEEALNPYYGY